MRFMCSALISLATMHSAMAAKDFHRHVAEVTAATDSVTGNLDFFDADSDMPGTKLDIEYDAKIKFHKFTTNKGNRGPGEYQDIHWRNDRAILTVNETKSKLELKIFTYTFLFDLKDKEMLPITRLRTDDPDLCVFRLSEVQEFERMRVALEIDFQFEDGKLYDNRFYNFLKEHHKWSFCSDRQAERQACATAVNEIFLRVVERTAKLKRKEIAALLKKESVAGGQDSGSSDEVPPCPSIHDKHASEDYECPVAPVYPGAPMNLSGFAPKLRKGAANPRDLAAKQLNRGLELRDGAKLKKRTKAGGLPPPPPQRSGAANPRKQRTPRDFPKNYVADTPSGPTPVVG